MSRMSLIMAGAVVATAQAFAQSTVDVTDATGNNYGNTSGIAVDFDATTGISADWMPDLAAGSTYQVDSLSLFLGNGFGATGDWYLGVYSILDENLGGTASAQLGGFVGVSDNTIDLNAAANDVALTWTFSGAAPTVTPELNPGSGGDILYFVLQTGTSALTEVPAMSANNQNFRRINDATGTFDDELAAVIHGARNGATTDNDVVFDRVLEYQAQVTLIPEPSVFALAGLGIAGLVISRRRA